MSAVSTDAGRTVLSALLRMTMCDEIAGVLAQACMHAIPAARGVSTEERVLEFMARLIRARQAAGIEPWGNA